MKAGGGAAQPVGSLDSALAHALDLIEGQPALALEQATEILTTVPGHPIATLLVGMAQRRPGDPAPALDTLEHLCERPTDVAAIRMFAEVAARLGRYQDAENLLARCLELAPGFHGARHNYAVALFRQGKHAAALPEIERLLAIEPRNPNYRSLHAAVLAGVAEYARAIDIYVQALKEYPRQAKIWLSYGHVLKTSGAAGE